jgi:hypothetical protein
MSVNLSTLVKITKVKDHSTAATSAVNSDGVDMAGYEGVLFLTSFGTAASDNTCNLAQSDDNGSSDDFTDLTGTSVTSGSSDEDVYLDIYRPQKRYVRLEAARGTSSTLESIWAIQYGPRSAPVDNTTSGTIVGEFHAEPAEGTA